MVSEEDQKPGCHCEQFPHVTEVSDRGESDAPVCQDQPDLPWIKRGPWELEGAVRHGEGNHPPDYGHGWRGVDDALRAAACRRRDDHRIILTNSNRASTKPEESSGQFPDCSSGRLS